MVEITLRVSEVIIWCWLEDILSQLHDLLMIKWRKWVRYIYRERETGLGWDAVVKNIYIVMQADDSLVTRRLAPCNGWGVEGKDANIYIPSAKVDWVSSGNVHGIFPKRFDVLHALADCQWEKETRKRQVKQTRDHLYFITRQERNTKNKQTYPEVLALHKEQMIVVSWVAKKNKSRRKSNDNGVSHSLTSTWKDLTNR